MINLYHGTSSLLKNLIKRKGLSAKRYEAGDDGIFLTDRWDIAEHFAELTADRDGSRGILLCEVQVDPETLSPDYIMYDMPP